MTAFRWRHLAKNGVLSLMVVLWLGVTAFALCPQLHRFLHQDAGTQSHECLFTSIQQSQLLADGVEGVRVPLPCLGLDVLVASEVRGPAAFGERFSPSRAPPFHFVSSRLG